MIEGVITVANTLDMTIGGLPTTIAGQPVTPAEEAGGMKKREDHLGMDVAVVITPVDMLTKTIAARLPHERWKMESKSQMTLNRCASG